MMSSAPQPTTGNPTPPTGRCAPEPRLTFNLEKWEEGYQCGAAGKAGEGRPVALVLLRVDRRGPSAAPLARPRARKSARAQARNPTAPQSECCRAAPEDRDRNTRPATRNQDVRFCVPA